MDDVARERADPATGDDTAPIASRESDGSRERLNKLLQEDHFRPPLPFRTK